MASILVTGGAGYIGSVLTPALLNAGHHVTVLDTLRHGENSLAAVCGHPAFDIVCGDVRETRIVKPLVGKADIIIPLAAIVGAPACDKSPTEAWDTNTSAVQMICDYATREQRIIIPNTNSGYGVGGEEECTEDSPLRPISVYGRSKVHAEEFVLARENSISLRLATVFGASPRMRVDLMLNDFVYRACTDRCISLFEPHFRRNFVHVTDVAKAFLHAIDNFDAMKGKPYNVGDTRANMSKYDLCMKIRESIPDFHVNMAPMGEDIDKRDYIVSNARIEAAGWSPKVSVDDGIMELKKLYRMLRVRQYSNA